MEERNLRKTRVGVVVSDKMDKTIVVAVKDSVQHPLYKKILKRTVKFKARGSDSRDRARSGGPPHHGWPPEWPGPPPAAGPPPRR